jgi:hypothetical protein
VEAAQRVLMMKRSPSNPPLWVVERVAEIASALADGTPFHRLRGKRLLGYGAGSRMLISIPLGQRWRLVCRENEAGHVTPAAILSHERYNRLRRGKMQV